jgi:diguanylate cyclase (GGDEF)-like protein
LAKGQSKARLQDMIRGFHSAKTAIFCTLFCALMVLFAPGGAGAADGMIPVDDQAKGLDLASLRNPIVSQRTDISVQGPQEKSPATLTASGPGPSYYWSLYSFQNSTNHPLSVVMTFKPTKSQAMNAIGAVLTRDNVKLVLSMQGNMQIARFQIAANGSANVAVESLEPDLRATLWQAKTFDAAADLWQKPGAFLPTPANASSSETSILPYFLGLIEGTVLLVFAGMLALWSYRPHRAALAGWLFVAASVLFIESHGGYLVSHLGYLSFSSVSWQVAAESLMACVLAICVLAFLGVSPLGSVLGIAMLIAAGLACANVIYGVVEPERASFVAKAGFAALALTGLAATYRARRRAKTIVDPQLLFWLALLAWTIFAAVVFLQRGSSMLFAVLEALLVAVVVVQALALLRFVLVMGLAARPFITDANLRSLALSGGRHVMWDFQPDQQSLTVGKELATQLNLVSTRWDTEGREKFREMIHPLDLAAYEKLVEGREFRPGERLELELRLRDADGAYHWHALKALAVPGPGNGVDRCIGTITDISKLKEAEERLSSDALQDAVTGLPNKALFLDRLERNMSMQGAAPFRVLIVDLDRFKILNDGLGQDLGDKLLKITADRLSTLVEPEETVARLTGSQFAVQCMATIARGDFSDFLKTLDAAVAAPIKLGAQHVVLGASVGVSALSTGSFKATELLDQANVAMLEARAEGGGRASIYHAEMKDDRAKLLSLESDLRRAIVQNEIEIHYQPIVYLATLDVAGFEALARWRHPDLGLLTPVEFMDVAEAAGMMPEIGQYILAGAGRQLGIWQRVHMRGRAFFVSVNVSATQLMAQDLPRQVKQVLERESLEPGSLKLEITETVIMRQPERAANILRQLQAMGVGLACDDFGTGFSSLASLRDFPFDTLKIDRSFIAPDNFTDRNGKIITSITTLARSLNMAVVAEGIETQEQIDNLAALGCGLGQGYLIGVPETADQAGVRLVRLNTAPPHSSSFSTPAPTPLLSQLGQSRVQPPTVFRSLYEPKPGALPFSLKDETGIFDDEAGKAEELPSIFAVTRPLRKKPVPPRAKVKKAAPRKRR